MVYGSYRREKPTLGKVPDGTKPPDHRGPTAGPAEEDPMMRSRVAFLVATGLALARANVDFSSFLKSNVEAEERRLMPKYVEDQFINAAQEIGLKMEPRADGLWRSYAVFTVRSRCKPLNCL